MGAVDGRALVFKARVAPRGLAFGLPRGLGIFEDFPELGLRGTSVW